MWVLRILCVCMHMHGARSYIPVVYCTFRVVVVGKEEKKNYEFCDQGKADHDILEKNIFGNI